MKGSVSFPKKWNVLKVLRDNPQGVTSEFLVKNHVGLYHKWSSRCSDLRDDGYMVTEAEKVDGSDWNYRWKLLNPEFWTPEEVQIMGAPRIFNQNGQGEFLTI